jgi:hypothetical protein
MPRGARLLRSPEQRQKQANEHDKFNAYRGKTIMHQLAIAGDFLSEYCFNER